MSTKNIALVEINDNIFEKPEIVPAEKPVKKGVKRKKDDEDRIELKENWETMIIKDPPVQKKQRKPPIKKSASQNIKRKKKEDKTSIANQNDKKNKTEKQKKVKLKWHPMEKLDPDKPIPSFDGSLAELIPKESNPDFTPASSLYYSSSVIKHFTAPSSSAQNFILNLNQASAKTLINENY